MSPFEMDNEEAHVLRFEKADWGAWFVLGLE